MQIFGFLGSLLGYVLWGAFYLLKDFGLSIIVFTIIVRLCMFPFTIKQQKSMAGTARLSKKQKEIQEKYKNQVPEGKGDRRRGKRIHYTISLQPDGSHSIKTELNWVDKHLKYWN